MPEFLSDEWVAALDERARRLGPASEIAPFVLVQVVSGDDARPASTYRITFTGEGVTVARDGAEPADVTFETDRATAIEIARGTLNAQRALATGRYRVRGDIAGLVARSAALTALDDVFAAVRAATTYR